MPATIRASGLRGHAHCGAPRKGFGDRQMRGCLIDFTMSARDPAACTDLQWIKRRRIFQFEHWQLVVKPTVGRVA